MQRIAADKYISGYKNKGYYVDARLADLVLIQALIPADKAGVEGRLHVAVGNPQCEGSSGSAGLYPKGARVLAGLYLKGADITSSSLERCV